MPFPNRGSAPEGASRVKGGQITAQAVVPRCGIVSEPNRESTPWGVARVKAGDEWLGPGRDHETPDGASSAAEADGVDKAGASGATVSPEGEIKLSETVEGSII